MTDQQKATQEDQKVPFDLSSCMAMMEEMMGQQEGGCDCTEMMSQMMGRGDCAAMMSQMTASCCVAQEETADESTTTDTI